jgi:hypothetical protein
LCKARRGVILDISQGQNDVSEGEFFDENPGAFQLDKTY